MIFITVKENDWLNKSTYNIKLVSTIGTMPFRQHQTSILIILELNQVNFIIVGNKYLDNFTVNLLIPRISIFASHGTYLENLENCKFFFFGKKILLKLCKLQISIWYGMVWYKSSYFCRKVWKMRLLLMNVKAQICVF